MKFPTFLVGGAVRDDLLGRDSKDLDFAVEAPSFGAMRAAVVADGGEVFTENPEFFTLRAKDRTGSLTGQDNLTADFVLCRRDGESANGRHPDEVFAGSLLDDLARRDFTFNAMARPAGGGELVDPFGGQADLDAGVVRAVGVADERFREDALRVLRAVRFAVVLGFAVEDSTATAMLDPEVVGLLASTSVERKRDELAKAFRADTHRTMEMLMGFPEALRRAMLPDGLRLEPTLKR